MSTKRDMDREFDMLLLSLDDATEDEVICCLREMACDLWRGLPHEKRAAMLDVLVVTISGMDDESDGNLEQEEN